MLIEKDGKYFKYVCPECSGDNIGESGMGIRLVHCFGSCMADFPKSQCLTQEVTAQSEIILLRQMAY